MKEKPTSMPVKAEFKTLKGALIFYGVIMPVALSLIGFGAYSAFSWLVDSVN